MSYHKLEAMNFIYTKYAMNICLGFVFTQFKSCVYVMTWKKLFTFLKTNRTQILQPNRKNCVIYLWRWR